MTMKEFSLAVFFMIVSTILGIGIMASTVLAITAALVRWAVPALLTIGAVYAVGSALSKSGPLPHREDAGQEWFQFDLRDLLLAFLVAAGAMGAGRVPGIIVGLYLLLAIVLFRIARATRNRLVNLGLAAWFVLGIYFFCIAPIPRYVRSPDPRSTCKNNLKNIALALQAHLSKHNSLPEAHPADENGVPRHSWRIAILPHLDRADIYQAYDYDEPWNGPNNSQLDHMLMVFRCPSDPAGGPPFTNYVAVTGPRTAWPEGRGSVPDDFRDGMSNTMLVTEVHQSGIHWMEPRDLTLDDLARGMQPESGLGISSDHNGGACVAFADGRVRFLSNQTSPELLHGLATVDGGEQIGATTLDNLPPAPRQPVRPTHGSLAWFLSLFLMLISAGVLAFRPLRKNDPRSEPESDINGASDSES